jgi:nucleoside permease NupC
MLISFIALVSLFNGLIGLIPGRRRAADAAAMLGWACAPLAYLMGIPWTEAPAVGSILGTRSVLTRSWHFSSWPRSRACWRAFGRYRNFCGVRLRQLR